MSQQREIVEYVISLGDGYARQAGQAADATHRLGSSAGSAEKGLGSLQRVAEKSAGMMGGVFGDVADVLFDVAGGISESGGAIGSLGVAAGIGAAGVAAIGIAALGGASAIHDMVMGAEALQKRLGEISGSEPLPPETTEALDDYRQTALGAEAASADLKVQVAGLAAAAFEPAMAAAAGLLGRLDDLLPSADALTGTLDTMTNVGRAGVAVFTLGASEAVAYALGLRDLEEDGRAAAAALDDLAAAGTRARQSTGEAVTAIQRDAMLSATGASDAQIRLVQSTDAIDAAVQAYVDTLDLAVEADRALADAAFESGQLRKDQLQSALEQAEAEKALAEAKRDGAAADRESAAAAKVRAAALAELDAEASADAARVRAELLAQNDAALAGDAANAALASTAGSIDTSGLEGAISGLGGDIAGSALQGLLPVLSGGAGGAVGALGAAGPVGAAIAAVVGLPDLIDGIADTLGGLGDMFDTLPDRLGTALGETLPNLIGDLPDLVTAIVQAVLELPGVIVQAVPELVSELTQLVPRLIVDLGTMLVDQIPALFADGLEFLLSGGLIGAVAEGVWDALNDLFAGLPQKFADKIGEALMSITKPFQDKEGRVLGTDFTAEGGRSLFGVELPSFDRGSSEITRTGVAKVHKGEEITRAGRGRSAGGGHTFHIYGPDTREIIRQIREVVGGDFGPGYGLGETVP